MERASPNHFAPPSTRFLGRSQEIAEIGALLSDPSCRLLTFVGPGGIGKTRLAMEVASRHRAVFPDGVFYVPLAQLSRVDDLLPAIAEAMPFRFHQGHGSPGEQFFAYLREKQTQQVLLVLDNMEHLLGSVDLIAEILAATTSLKILATSREALNLEEEWIKLLTGLTYPDWKEEGQSLREYNAVQLFLDRARRIRGDFDLAEDESGVVDICRLVEGMPLAIELAAGWLKTLQPTDIAQELQRNLDLLATRSRNLPERHRSMRSVFSHSWQLMSEEDREVFQKLSVFRGGFTREAAEVIAGASLATLARLIDQSLVRRSAAGHYDLHELLRQYGAEQLEAAGQAETVEQAYIDYYLGLLHRLERDIKAHQQIAALDTIAADFENVRYAWHLAVQQRQAVALSGAVESLQWFADMRGRYHEIVAMLQTAIQQLSSPQTQEQLPVLSRIQARLMRLILLGGLRIEQDLRAQIDVCLALAHARQDQAEIGFCLLVAGILAVWEESENRPHLSARPAMLFAESAMVFEQLHDPFYQADALSWWACEVPPMESTQQQSGQALLKQSLDLRRAIGDSNGIAWNILNLASVAIAQGDYLAYEHTAREALASMREIKSVKGILQALFHLAHATFLKGEFEEALALAEHMRALASETSNLEGARLSADLLAFLLYMMDEVHAEGPAPTLAKQPLSLDMFFSCEYNLGMYWGQALADCEQGRYAAARLGYAAVFHGRHDDPGPATLCLALEAIARAHEDMPEAATELLGLAFQQPSYVSGWLQRWSKVSRLRADLRRQLGEQAYHDAWERGALLDLDTTIRSLLGEASETPSKRVTHAVLEPLSKREFDVLSLIAQGLSNRDIAQRLVLSVGTVKVHTRNIYSKLGVGSRTQALAQAAKFKLL
ncbi:MAG: LuxR C-terminal-related transcriptional regulator [Ktedonobacterales bacterium]